MDLTELPLTTLGNRYVIVFLDYLTKWVEAYPLPDQTSETIARVLVDRVICRHGVPRELLSDHGANLLSAVILDVCRLTGMAKINTTAYHPQTDGLVENFNRTLCAMLAKHSREFGPEWDIYLQHLLFAYRTKPHESTGESPFFLLYHGTWPGQRYGRLNGAKRSSMIKEQNQPHTRKELGWWCLCRRRQLVRTGSWHCHTMGLIVCWKFVRTASWCDLYFMQNIGLKVRVCNLLCIHACRSWLSKVHHNFGAPTALCVHGHWREDHHIHYNKVNAMLSQ